MRLPTRGVPSPDAMLRTLPGRLFTAGALAFTLFVGPLRPTRAGELPAGFPRPAALHAEEPPPRPTFPLRRTQIGVPENNPLELYPPSAPSLAEPLILALHGKDQDPIDLCDGFRLEGRARGWLVCPAGNTASVEPGEAFDWGGSTEDRIAALDAQLAAVEAVYGPLVERGRDVLVGFSRGAFLARDLVYARPGRFRAMVLLGAAVRFDPERLRAAGVKRVLLAAGELDEARSTMEHTAQFLAARGVQTRFVSLGPIFHKLPPDLGRVMGDALRWVREGES
jgi:predicted esterase